ncbi:MAG: hypothetical protein HQL43_00345 [Alphaproteobacteria bacterium]|nr:hypothetical protein [Alphaproteobacteria bacterium]
MKAGSAIRPMRALLVLAMAVGALAYQLAIRNVPNDVGKYYFPKEKERLVDYLNELKCWGSTFYLLANRHYRNGSLTIYGSSDQFPPWHLRTMAGLDPHYLPKQARALPADVETRLLSLYSIRHLRLESNSCLNAYLALPSTAPNLPLNMVLTEIPPERSLLIEGRFGWLMGPEDLFIQAGLRP